MTVYKRFSKINFFLFLLFFFPGFLFPNDVPWLPRDRKDRIIKVSIVLRSDGLNCCCNRLIMQVPVGEQKGVALSPYG